MVSNVINFYMDDSGTRHPDHKVGKRAGHGYDWFALGGVLVADSDEALAREMHETFCRRWGLTEPIHSVEVRSRTKGFLWLERRPQRDRDIFYEELYQLMMGSPVVGLACVIDRPGYNARYREKYGRERWSLCKSAFTISVERAAKYARERRCRLRVMPERCNKAEDRVLKGYYENLKKDGPPFDPNTSEKYRPLSPQEFSETLLEFAPKMKSSPMAQMADLYLWPICMGGYNPDCRPYERLKSDGKLIEYHLSREDWPNLGSKYYCFDGPEKPMPESKNPAEAGSATHGDLGAEPA
ncbi:DUF3800 domain-containing protein [Bradyrhizobium sp. CCBAU 45389]|uniref:DUF3800 domain-containing protein n=1 Tax=Bradyrhizobium sp. CCBAU 45389 TaxID=858429 RepID=UPI0023069B3F|nr:DUF3800 domain-containing protein [Bradyrhizobium sp. CCBAU 45389]